MSILEPLLQIWREDEHPAVRTEAASATAALLRDCATLRCGMWCVMFSGGLVR